MKALISPLELRETGYRVAEICTQSFEVADPLFWVDCGNDVVADLFWYSPTDETFKTFPEPEPVELLPQPISQGSQDL